MLPYVKLYEKMENLFMRISGGRSMYLFEKLPGVEDTQGTI